MNTKKLMTSGFLYTLGNIFVQAIGFITLPIYTRIISQEVFGKFSLFSSYMSIFMLVIGLQVSGSLSAAKVKYANEYDRYAVSAFHFSGLFAFSLLLLALLFRKLLGELFGFSEQVIVLLAVQTFNGYCSGFLGAYFIQKQESVANFLLSFGSAIVNTVISIGLITVMTDDFLARVYGGVIPSSVLMIITVIYFQRKKQPFFDKKYLSFMLMISLPLIFHQLGHLVLNQLDRIMLGKMLSIKEVAIYSFGYTMGMIIQTVLNSINMAWIPWFFEAKKKKDKRLHYYVLRYLALGLFLTLGYLTIFPDLALLMGGEKYSQSIDFIAMIIISYFFVFLYTFPVNIQFYYANTRMIPIGTIAAGVVNAVLNYFFIPKFGIYGAAVATVLSYLSLLVFHHIISRKRYQYDEVTVKVFLIFSLIAIGYALLMNQFSDSLPIRWCLGIMVVIAYGVYFKTDVQALYQVIVRKKKE
ncbi:O-antigen/teichoic acid export membrane protein [Streptococcus gallinaceus]|uniref:oligosaccharide flippase family protein n=1 Tax=Streptococcus gallinaceus TaxID=165758 RepID=UPI0020A12530|nr:oligosaccharide flippase family protein [Streptococcus gallinaceus]MCP1639218.1 O-antigen/teichoic acid export membrane protein [Streptococcus gallinaceus]MCP1770138.1 O-antigen/teichoic acid export membrane protein [Streptococcus gallinaceus]